VRFIAFVTTQEMCDTFIEENDEGQLVIKYDGGCGQEVLTFEDVEDYSQMFLNWLAKRKVLQDSKKFQKLQREEDHEGYNC